MLKRRSHGGFRLGRKMLGFWRRALCGRRGRQARYVRLRTCSGDCKERAARKLAPVLRWGRSLARRLSLSLGWRSGGSRALDGDDDGEAALSTPKGQVAVYVGGAAPGESSMRYVVPVVYFNHPVFGELLREAEEECGFQHPGGITIPCPAARFERVAAVAAAGKKGFGRW